MKLAKRMSTLNESLTIAISTRAKELKASGKDVLIFSAGEPDFDTPDVVKNAVITAMQKGCGKYPSSWHKRSARSNLHQAKKR